MIKEFILIAFISTVSVGEKIKTLTGKEMSVEVVGQITSGINKCKGVNNNLLLALIMTESSFNSKAYNSKTKDYGLMQISEWHVKRSGLNRDRLINDPEYNIKVGCEILQWFLKRYPESEAIGRYNGGTGKDVMEWRAVKKYVGRVYFYKKMLDE
jgi:soluble lytic murein transglycosylase-like protein